MPRCPQASSRKESGEISLSSFCSLCWRDPDTGEYFCPRFGGWHEKCPAKDDDKTPWDPEEIEEESEDA